MNLSKIIYPAWQKRRAPSTEKILPPWEYPEAQPPPPPVYAGYSPLPKKKIVQRSNTSQLNGKFHPNSENVSASAFNLTTKENMHTSDFKQPSNFNEQKPVKISNGFYPFDESSPLTNQNMSHENVSANQSCDEPKSVKTVPLINTNVPLHLVGQIGQTAKSESTTSVPLIGGQSYSETVTSEQSYESSAFSSMMVTTKSEVGPQDGSTTKKVLNQSPTPWRKAKTSPESVAKVDASASQPLWRKEKEPSSVSSESKEVTSSDMISSTSSQSTHFKQNQMQSSITQQSVSSLQQQQQQQQQVPNKPSQQPSQQHEVPWRSPQSKRREIGLSSPASVKKSSSSQTSQSLISTTQTAKTDTDLASTENVPSTQAAIIPLDVTIPQTNKPAPVSNAEVKKDSACDLPDIPPPPVPPQQGPAHKQSPYNTPKVSPKLPHKPATSEPLMPVTSTTPAVDSIISSGETNIMVLTENVTQISTMDIKEVTECVEAVKKGNQETQNDSQIKTEEIITIVPLPSVSPQPSTNALLPSVPPQVQLAVDITSETRVPEAEQTNIPPPPPPRFIKETQKDNQQFIPSQTPDSLALRMAGLPLQEGEKISPEYTREPVTSRIQKFEKQASSEVDKKDKDVPLVKPVAPWVKKTSSGPVHQEGWDFFPTEEVRLETLSRDHLTEEPSNRFPQSQRQISNDASVSSVTMVLSQPAKDQPPIAPVSSFPKPQSENLFHQNKQIQRLLTRPRTKSTGDYSHTYIENDTSNMPADCISSAAPLVPSASADKGDDPSLFDPWCDPKNPRIIQFQDVSAAAFKIKSGILNTPCTRSNMSSLVDMNVFFKKEFNQYTGSFKERGARYTLLCLTAEQKTKGVIAASAGNHALALSYHGQDLGIPVTVVMPLVAPIMKVQACRQYGANILVKGNDIGECREIALRMANEQGLLYVNGYDHPHILAGQGTMGLEIVEQVPNIDAVVVPVGGGGLIAGVALAVKSLYPHVKVIGVESEKCASFSAALKANKPVYVKAESTLADGLAVPQVGVNAFATASKLIDKIVTVREEWIAIAILRLVEMEKAVVEGAGAAALAALLAGELPELKGKRVVIPLCGGNIDTTVLGRCLERGLAADGRLVKFTVTVSDRPGGIADLTRLLANLGVSIKDMLHERAWIRSDIFSVEVKVLCETRDYAHSEELREALLQKYKILRFGNDSLQYSNF